MDDKNEVVYCAEAYFQTLCDIDNYCYYYENVQYLHLYGINPNYVFFCEKGIEEWLKEGGTKVMMSCPNFAPRTPCAQITEPVYHKPQRLGDGIPQIPYPYEGLYCKIIVSRPIKFW